MTLFAWNLSTPSVGVAAAGVVTANVAASGAALVAVVFCCCSAVAVAEAHYNVSPIMLLFLGS